MAIEVVTTNDLMVGSSVVIEGGSPKGNLVAVFEDDGQTGYFYALDMAAAGNPIQDAMHIYNVSQIADREIASTVKIGWSSDGRKVVLLINNHPHAVFDFENRKGYCRSAFPPVSPSQDWSKDGHGWNNLAIEALFR
ncbi:DUF2251 domain-containing protein [Dyella humi]|uniref:DUF2251 domain-containing protein n=1 Tax=Dyella humi TaxID=1770547 RepID=A0ABW8IM63_9GAMM